MDQADHLFQAPTLTAKPMASLKGWLAEKGRKHGEAIVYRAAGLLMTLATAVGAQRTGKTTLTIRKYYLRHFWAPEEATEWLDIAVAAIICPIALLVVALWVTWRNGGLIARREGKSASRQFFEQIWLALTRGILPPWYYVFELHRADRWGGADNLLTRAETKEGAYRILARRRASRSPLGDKVAFERHCRVHQLPTIAVLAIACDGAIDFIADDLRTPPSGDLFIKPVRGSGGSGTERWNRLGPLFLGSGGRSCDWQGLLRHLAERSRKRPMMLQPRMVNDTALSGLNNGALSTVRVLTCLDEQEQPEVIGAVLRMAIGSNEVVDNLHAGGVAAAVDLATGRLACATNLGMDVRLGRTATHPTTGHPISGFELPHWPDVLALACRAHHAFADHALVGWDIALIEGGLCLVEGNSGPDLDIMQRVAMRPIGCERLGELLAFHLRNGETVQPHTAL